MNIKIQGVPAFRYPLLPSSPLLSLSLHNQMGCSYSHGLKIFPMTPLLIPSYGCLSSYCQASGTLGVFEPLSASHSSVFLVMFCSFECLLHVALTWKHLTNWTWQSWISFHVFKYHFGTQSSLCSQLTWPRQFPWILWLTSKCSSLRYRTANQKLSSWTSFMRR